MARRQTVAPAVRREVIARWGNDCWLHLPGCTGAGEEDDHIVPWSHRGRDSVANIRRACKHCNAARQDRVLSGYGPTMHVVLGPPGADLMGAAEPYLKRDSIVVSHAQIMDALSDEGRRQLMSFARYLAAQPELCERAPEGEVTYIRHYLFPAAAGYASPIEGEEYVLEPRGGDTPAHADFAVTIAGDSMEPHIHDGDTVYVQRDATLREFDVGLFYLDGDVLCKQYCVDAERNLLLLSANPLREDANRRIPADSGSHVVYYGKVLLDRRLPQPSYY